MRSLSIPLLLLAGLAATPSHAATRCGWLSFYGPDSVELMDADSIWDLSGFPGFTEGLRLNGDADWFEETGVRSARYCGCMNINSVGTNTVIDVRNFKQKTLLTCYRDPNLPK